jgi:hypothetical protein
MKPSMKTIIAVGLASSMLLMTGCASVFKGQDQVLSFSSEPDGATVRIDGKVVGQTPMSTKVKKSSVDSISIEKDGFKTETMAPEKRFDNVAFLNIFWDLSTTDLITGAAYEYQPSNFHYKLKKETK